MRVSGEAFSERLKGYSDDTILLLMSLNNRELYLKGLDIIATTDSEEEVVKKLHQLKKNQK